MTSWVRVVALVATVVGVTGCGSFASGTFGGGAGATPGGAQDLSLARAKVDAGQVPLPEDLPYEGLFSEHDLPLDGAPCTELLCVRAGAVTAPDFGATAPSAWVQLALSSNVDLSTFHRPALNAAIVLDNSGSMGSTKMEAAKAAADRLIDLLGPDDLLTVVVFDDVSHVLVGPVAVSDKARLHAQVAGIHAQGGTCIECGLRDGFARLEQGKSATRANRLFLFTDAQPNVGATGAGDFMSLLTAAAEQELFASVFGVGLDFGQALTTQISAVTGANAFFLPDEEKTAKVFDEDFDLLVTPLAFDLTFSLQPAAPLSVGAVYGVPGEAGAGFSSTVKTVFLSRRRGAIVARLEGALPAGAELGTVRLSYRPANAAAAQDAVLPVTLPQGDPQGTPGVGARKAVALTRLLTGLRSACDKHAKGDAAGAAEDAQAAALVIEAEASASQDPALAAELGFARALQGLLETGPQGP